MDDLILEIQARQAKAITSAEAAFYGRVLTAIRFPESTIADQQIERMARQFLNWNLPADFAPDGGVTFEPVGNTGTPYEYRRNPTGTNLLNFNQAVEMIRHMIGG